MLRLAEWYARTDNCITMMTDRDAQADRSVDTAPSG
jgi:hypothetical protein